jgi:hypothetical protein
LPLLKSSPFVITPTWQNGTQAMKTLPKSSFSAQGREKLLSIMLNKAFPF